MVFVQLSGVHVVRVKAKGKVYTYHYAWRGGPRLDGEPGSPEYVASYQRAHAQRKKVKTNTFRDLLAEYRASERFRSKSEATKRDYNRYLDLIEAKFGSLPLAALDDPNVRQHFLKWRDSMAATPRAADYAVSVLKAVLSWGVEYVKVQTNQAEPIGRLHKADKSDHIWTPQEVEAFAREASKELVEAVLLGLYTGLRQADLVRLAWNHEVDGAFDLRTKKRNREAVVPITAECRALLNRIAKRGPIILTTHRGGRPWTQDGLRSSFNKACERAGVERTFHDLRRTAATYLLGKGLEASQVAMVMGWSEAAIEDLKRKYVSRAAVVQAVLAKLEKAV